MELSEQGRPQASLFGPRLLDAGQVAEILNVSVSWVREHSNPNGPEPRLPSMKFGEGKTASVRYHPDDLIAFISQQRQSAKARSTGRRWNG